MKTACIIFMTFIITACSAISPVDKESIAVNNALKACGLGYSSEAEAIIHTAYEISNKNGSADFKASLKDSLNTQIMAFSKSSEITKSADSDKLISLIKGTQECVINTIDATRPKTKSELVNQCVSDLQNMVAGQGNNWPKVKETYLVTNHPDYSDNNLIITAFVDNGGKTALDSYNLLVDCQIKNDRYQSLKILQRTN